MPNKNELTKLIEALQANTEAVLESGGTGSKPGETSGEKSTLGFKGLGGSEQTKAIKELKSELDNLKSTYDGIYRRISQNAEIQEKQIDLDIKQAIAAGKSTEEIKKRYAALTAETSAANQMSLTAQKGMGLTLDSTSEKFVKIGQDMADVGRKGGSIAGTMGKAAADLGARAIMKPIELLVSQTIALAQAQDKVISQFRKATGATSEYNYELTQLERRNFAAGVSIADAGKSFRTLFTSFSAFTELNKSERAAIGDTVAVLGELNVSAEVSGKILDQTFRGLGMSIEKSNDVLLDLAGSAQALGVPMSKMAADFSSAFVELAKHGDAAIDVFKELSVIAKSTGMEVSKLIAITQQFETFEGSAKAVGKLNAILGGPYLNSIDMLNAKEGERIKILRDQVALSGLQFDQLERYEKKAIASALNVKVDEAQRLLGLSEEQYKLDALSQEQASKLAAEAQTISDEIKSALMALAVDLRPLIDDVIKPLVGAFSAVARGIGKATNALGQFASVGLLAGGIAALIAAPFTGGGSLAAYATIAGIGTGVGLATAGLANASSGATGAKDTGAITPGFAQGGMITTEQAAVHPGELIMTGAQGAEVISQNKFDELIAAVKSNISPPQQIAVYVGQEKIDELIVKGINSPVGQAAFSPFGNG